MRSIYQFIGLDTAIVCHENVTSEEKKIFKSVGVFLILACLISFFGSAQLFYFISENYLFSIFSAAFWMLIYINLYRLLLLISFNESENSNTITLSNCFNILFLVSFSMVGAVGFICFGFYLLYSNDIPHGIIDGVSLAFDFISSKGRFISFIVFWGLSFGMTVPFLLIISSPKIKLGGYLQLLRQQKKDMIIGNHQVFKANYREVLLKNIDFGNLTYNYKNQDKESLFSDENKTDGYDFYDAFEDAPFNTIRKVEW